MKDSSSEAILLLATAGPGPAPKLDPFSVFRASGSLPAAQNTLSLQLGDAGLDELDITLIYY
jgi:hypothetical protein